ncbi:MAG: putative O-glycosylation ligase (exosortase A-associated) [Planctomycetota bacterium]|jgi:probable O-glycosylation ligase (exosortase A-associated)
MRDLFVVMVITGLMPACFRRPYVGLLVFSWLAYMRVQDLSWGTVRTMRWSFFIAFLTGAGYIANPKQMRGFLPDIRCFIMITLVILVCLGVWNSEPGHPLTDKAQFGRMVEFTKIIGIALFTTAVVVSKEHLRVLVWVIALSFGFYGVKSGIWAIFTLGRVPILVGPGGMLADNNDFALALAMSIPMLFHLGLSEKKELLRKVFHYTIPLTMITIAVTHSRGGMLSLVGGCGVLIWRSKNRVAGFTAAGLLGLTVLMVGPSGLRDRLSTLKDVEQDSSASARFRSWGAATRMATDNAVLGVGLNKFRQSYMRYQPNPTAMERKGDAIYVAHNSYLQIWAETGTISLLLYLYLIGATFRTCWKVRKLAKRRYYASWMINYATMFEASLFTFCIGSTFLNRAHFDLVYHFFAIVLVFEKLAMDELNAGAPIELRPKSQSRRGGDLRRIRSSGFSQPQPRNGFRDTPLLGGGN